ncbi:MAG: T9SS type A sorting domain-containing protein [Bacteroidetes bacterium]|nr:T9SS type A sorting domain-containing protein [Bacteroidota bacterium]
MKYFYVFILCWLSISVQAQWTKLPAFTTDPLTSVDFLDTENGLVCGSNKIWRTTNGSSSWTAVYTGDANISLEEVRWASDQVAVAVGIDIANNVGLIVRSTNGGQSWAKVSNSVVSIFTDLTFVSETVGYLCGGNTRILKTTNGGATWTSQFSDNNSDLYSIHFLNENEGYAAGGYANTGRLLHTTNGGSTWTDVSLPAPFLIQSVFFPSANVGYVAGVAGEMRKTVDGGANWTEPMTANTSNILDLYFFDNDFGYLVGGTLTVTSLQRTENGGSYWSNVAPNTGAGLFSIDVVGTTGYAVGVNGTVLKTDIMVAADEQLKAMGVTVFPNPAFDKIQVVAEQPLYFVEIYDANGRMLRRQEVVGNDKAELDVSALPAGCFFLKIGLENGINMMKMAKL